MNNFDKEKKRKRTIQNKVIATFNTARFSIVEPIKLNIARFKYEKEYKDPFGKPLVSVYVPTYNRGQLLMDRVVLSILAQTYTNFELIILGDCCTDNTEELVRSIDDPRVKFYNLPSRKKRYPVHGEHVENYWLAGPVVPANKALSMVKGKWIARVDDSVIWTPDHIESLLKFAIEGNYEFVTGNCLEKRSGEERLIRGELAMSPYFGFKLPIPGVYNPRIGGTSTVFYRSYLKFFKFNINCWRKKWNRVNDIDLALRMFKAGVRMGKLDKVVCDMPPRPGENSVGREAFEQNIKSRSELFKF